MSKGTGIDALDQVANITFQLSSGGLVGYGDEGFKAGMVGKPVVDATKEVTGAKAAEEANAIAREQFDQATAQAEEARKNSIQQNKNRQLQNSNNAGAAKASSNTASNTTSSNKVVGDVTDFLGL